MNKITRRYLRESSVEPNVAVERWNTYRENYDDYIKWDPTRFRRALLWMFGIPTITYLLLVEGHEWSRDTIGFKDRYEKVWGVTSPIPDPEEADSNS